MIYKQVVNKLTMDYITLSFEQYRLINKQS